MSFLDSFRQFKYPKEFRIAQPIWTPKLLSILDKLNDLSSQSEEKKDVGSMVDQHMDQNLFKLVAEIATGLWRVRQKMIHPVTGEPLDDMRRAYRHLESTWDVLVQAGIEIQEHTGKLFDSGMSLKVIAFQPMGGVDRERIIETIKPSIYFKKKPIQIGEVIVARPETPEG